MVGKQFKTIAVPGTKEELCLEMTAYLEGMTSVEEPLYMMAQDTTLYGAVEKLFDKLSEYKNIPEVFKDYDYDETKNGKYELPDVKWKVLGVEDGNLLIVSSSSVESLILGDKKDIKNTQEDYINGNIQLDEISKKYAKGKNVVSSRNITINDILKLTNIDESLIYNDIEYTYYWNSNKEPNYTSLNHGTGTFEIPHKNNFYWFDKQENEWNYSYKQEGNIATIVNDLHKFNNKIYDENQKIVYDVQENSQIYSMLFLNENGQNDSYWVNNKYIDATEQIVSYGYNVIKANSLNYEHLIQSNGITNEKKYGAKIVIAIK